MRSCLIIGNQTLAGPALAYLRDLGVEASGEIGAKDPVEAAHDAIRGNPVDEVILSTLPAGISRWLGQDAPSRLKAALSVPVLVVSADPAPVPNESG